MKKTCRKDKREKEILQEKEGKSAFFPVKAHCLADERR